MGVVNTVGDMKVSRRERREGSTRLHMGSSDNFLKSARARVRSLRNLDFPETSAPGGDASEFRGSLFRSKVLIGCWVSIISEYGKALDVSVARATAFPVQHHSIDEHCTEVRYCTKSKLESRFPSSS